MAETFEDHLKALEEAVGRLESGEETLATSLEIYERAVAHLKACHTLLSEAEMKVRVLAKDAKGALTETPFEPPPEE